MLELENRDKIHKAELVEPQIKQDIAANFLTTKTEINIRSCQKGGNFIANC